MEGAGTMNNETSDEVKIHRAWAVFAVIAVLAVFGTFAHSCDTNRDVLKACLATHAALECKQLDQH